MKNLGFQVNTYTIEVSMLGYEDHDSRQIIPYTDDLYAKVSSDDYLDAGACRCDDCNHSQKHDAGDCGDYYHSFKHNAGDVTIIMIFTSMRVTHIDQVGRNIARAFWDYYKIVAVIPLEVASTKLVTTNVFVFQDSSDDECGIPKPSRDLPGRPKSAAVTRSFNMDRLKEVERQRQQTAQTFDGEVSFDTNYGRTP